MVTRRALISLVVLAVILSLVLVVARAGPQVVGFSPSSKQAPVPANSPLRLTFSSSMRPESVEPRLSITPPRQGSATWDGDTLIFTPDQPWPTGVTVTVRLDAGAQSRLRLPMLSGETWSFQVSRPLLTYLWPASGPADLYALEMVAGEIQRLTTTPHGVLDYSVSPAENALYYSAANTTGGSDLYRLDRLDGITTVLLKCPDALCRSPQAAPQGDYLAFLRIAATTPGGAPAAQVRALKLEDGQVGVEITLRDLSQPSETLAWSSTGVLAFYDTASAALVFYDPESGQQSTIPNQSGQPGAWAPDGGTYIAPELLVQPGLGPSLGEPVNPSHLVRYNPVSGSAEDLTLLLSLEDGAPAFSPDGSLLAFARKRLDQPRWSLGGQLWLMNPDGSDARALTDDPAFNHTGFAWSLDGAELAYMRFNQTTLTDPPEIWLVNAASGNRLRLVIGGYSPQWTP